MKKRIITLMLALTLLVLTIHSASAQILQDIEDETIDVGVQKNFNILDYVNETYVNEWDLNFEVIISGTDIKVSQNQFSWTPMFKYGDEVTVTINAEVINKTNETHVETDTATFKWFIDNTGFSMTSINTANAPRSAIVEQLYEFQLQATSNREAAVENYAYSFVDNQHPDGMTMTDGKITWTPTIDQFGSHRVVVQAIPEEQPTDVEPITREFTINVQGMTIDRVEVRAEGSRLETISRANYLSESSPYLISRDAKLGDEIELRITIRNNLPDETDNELRDVEIEIYSFDIIGADGQDAFISRIRPGRTEDQTISFMLDPQDLHPDDSPFDIEIRVFGETRGGELYSDVWRLELRVETQRYALIFLNEFVSPTTVCPGDRIRVNTDLRNIGTRDLSNAGIRYQVPGLDIDVIDRNIEIDFDRTRTITKFFDIPNNAVPGPYFFELTAYPRATSTSDTATEFIMFTVNSCTPIEEEEEEEEEVVIITPPTDVVVPGTPVQETEGVRSTSIFARDSPWSTALLAALVVLLLIGVILLLILVLK